MTQGIRLQEGPTVALLEHFGTGNLGDDSTVEAVLQQIRRRWPEASIVGLSLNPEDTEKRHGIRSYPIRRTILTADWWVPSSADPVDIKASRDQFKSAVKAVLRKSGLYGVALPVVDLCREIAFLYRSLRIARTFDLLVVSGGGQLLDTWGPWGFPYTLFKWTMLARLSGARYCFLNVGAGPLTGRLGRWFVKLSLRRGFYVSYRDRKSMALLRSIGYRGEAQVVADNVYGLRLPHADARVRKPGPDGLVIGISPMAYCDPRRYWEKDQAIYNRYIRALAEFGAQLIRAGHRVRLFSSDIWFDLLAIADLKAAISEKVADEEWKRLTVDPVKDVQDLMHELSQVDCVVTCRYHGVVFAHLANVPVIALAHHPKISTLMDDFGLSEYCLDIRGFDASVLMESLRRLIAGMDDLTTRVPRKVAACRRELDGQFDLLFPPARSPVKARAQTLEHDHG